MAAAYTNLGNIYWARGDLDRAEEMYRKALDLYRQVGMARDIEKVQSWLDELAEGDDEDSRQPS